MGIGTGLMGGGNTRRWTTGTRTRPPTVAASTRFSQDFGIFEMIGDGGGSAAGGPWRLFRIGTGYGEPFA